MIPSVLPQDTSATKIIIKVFLGSKLIYSLICPEMTDNTGPEDAENKQKSWTKITVIMKTVTVPFTTAEHLLG